jgi:hypothetical protein
MSLNIENKLNTYVETNKLIKFINSVNELKSVKETPVIIHNLDSIHTSRIQRYGIYGGNIGLYQTENKVIDIGVCNFLDVLNFNREMISLALISGLIHEFRHAIQHRLMPTTFYNISIGKRLYYRKGEQYREQFIEKDARKFTEKTINKYKWAISEIFEISSEWEFNKDIIYINGFELQFQ